MTNLSVSHALALVQRVLDTAGAQSTPVAVAVVDVGGHVVASARGDGVGFVAADFARRKAVAATSFGAPTHALADTFAQDPKLTAAFTGSPDVSLLPGGFPVIVEGVCIGGVGISGGHYSQDQAVGEKALQEG